MRNRYLFGRTIVKGEMCHDRRNEKADRGENADIGKDREIHCGCLRRYIEVSEKERKIILLSAGKGADDATVEHNIY